MIKNLLSIVLVFAFLFVGIQRDYNVIINSNGLAQLIKVPSVAPAKNVSAPTVIVIVEATANSPPETI